jgi:putative ABC transport system permease protein
MAEAPGQDHSGLKDKSRGSTMSVASHRLVDVLVVCEVGLALGLLLGTGVIIRGLGSRLQSNPGFTTANLLLARTHLLGRRYASPTSRAQFISRSLDEIEAIPGVKSAVVVDPYPPAGEGRRRGLSDCGSG